MLLMEICPELSVDCWVVCVCVCFIYLFFYAPSVATVLGLYLFGFFCHHNWFSSSWHRDNNLLETFSESLVHIDMMA